MSSVFPSTVGAALRERSSSAAGVTLESDAGATTWTYAQLSGIASQWAGALQRHGVSRGDRVGLLGSTTPEFVASLFGTWAAGAVAVPLAVPTRMPDPAAFVAGVRDKVTTVGAAIVAADERITGLLGDPALGAPVAAFGTLASDLRDAGIAETDPGDTVLVQFTSGSTGRPRGVELSGAAVCGNTEAARERGRFATGDVFVGWLPLYHDFGLIGLTLWPFLCDLPAVLTPPEQFIAHPAGWMQAVARHRGTITAAPNFAYGLAARTLRSAGQTLDLSSLRIAANGAEPVDAATMDDFADAGRPHGIDPDARFAVYGLAEATLGVTTPDPGMPMRVVHADVEALRDGTVAGTAASPTARPLVSVGTPIRGVAVEVDAPGRIGEIRVRTEYAMTRYWAEPEATASTVRDGWIHTGDLGALVDGELVVTGRTKDMIIVGGRNVYPEDAERAASQVPGVRAGNSVAFGVQGSRREGIVLVAETRATGADAQTLARDVADKVLASLRVRAQHVLLVQPGALPKTPSGKLQRSRTREMLEAGEFDGLSVASAGRRS